LAGHTNHAHLYEPICLGQNIEKHASAPLYPLNSTHPHIDYCQKENLKIFDLSKEMTRLKAKVLSDHPKAENWLDYVKVSDIKDNCKHKIMYEKILATDEIDQNQDVMMYNVCKHTIFAAAKRQMKMAPKPEPYVADDFVNYAINKIEENVGEYLTNFGYSYQQWYEHNNAAKQKKIDEYYDMLQNRSKYTEKQIKQLESEEYEGICKIELQPTNGKPRMVCSIPVKTKVTMGPVTWQLEEIMAHHMPGYCGSKNNQQMSEMINKFIAQGFTKVVEGDGSAFDNTQDVTLKEIDRYLYRRVEPYVYHVPKQQFHKISQELYKQMAVNYFTEKGTKKTMFRYKILGSVFSGDADTTLCNTLRMALYNMYVNEKAGLKYGKDFVLFSKGDDFTVLYKPYISNDFIRQAYYKYFLKEAPTTFTVYGLGQVLKMLEFGQPDSISFCSLKAFFRDQNEETIILTRDINKFLNITRYSRKIKTLTGTKRKAYLIQQARALLASYKGIKIFDMLAEAFMFAASLVDENTKDFTMAINYATEIQGIIKNKILKGDFRYEDENTILLYGIKSRQKFYKIEGAYWETMKYIQEMANYNLTQEEADYINKQIENMIAIEIFKSSMGLNSELYYKCKTKLLSNNQKLLIDLLDN